MLQEYFPSYLRPFLHELKIYSREQDSDIVKQVPVVYEKQLKAEYGSDSSCLVTISDVDIPPNSEIVISFGLRKIMIPFEDYPNDPNRGFNIA